MTEPIHGLKASNELRVAREMIAAHGRGGPEFHQRLNFDAKSPPPGYDTFDIGTVAEKLEAMGRHDIAQHIRGGR